MSSEGKGSADGNQACSALDEFIGLWKSEEAPPDVDAFLAGKGEMPVESLLELLLEDMHRRWETGRTRPAAEYLARYPAISSNPKLATDLVYEEFRIRVDLGERPDLAEYIARFPDLREPLERQFRLAGLLVDSSPKPNSTILPDPAAAEQRFSGTKRELDPQGLEDTHDFLSVSDFELGDPFPAGGMGVVYRAWQRSLERPVALKFLHGPERQSPDGPRRLLDEARVLALLRHQHIVRVWGFGACPRRGFFLVMELIDGPSLAQRLRTGKLEVHQAAAYAADVAEAIQHAHRRGVVHCDLKPANVLLDLHADGGPRAMVTDFGLARRIGPEARGAGGSDLWAGTLPYLAPEQATEGWGPVGPWTDIYGIGALLFAMLTGRPPCNGKTREELREQVVSHDPLPRVRTVRRDVPRGLDAIVARCLDKDPTRRYRSAEELARELRDRVQPRPRRLVLASLAAAAIGVPALVAALSTKFQPKLPKVDIVGLKVLCGDPGVDLVQQPSDVAPGDHLSFVVKLSRPAYPCLFLIQTDGNVERLFPDSRFGAPDRPVDQFTAPADGQAVRLDGREGTVAAVVIVGSDRLRDVEIARIEAALKARAPLRERLDEHHHILVNGMTPETWTLQHDSTVRPRTLVYPVEPELNIALDRLRAELPVGDRSVEILILRQSAN